LNEDILTAEIDDLIAHHLGDLKAVPCVDCEAEKKTGEAKFHKCPREWVRGKVRRIAIEIINKPDTPDTDNTAA
jgi:hypothetical protein